MDINGEKIRKIRFRLGLTQRQFGELLGVSHVTVCRWEQVEFIKPSPKHYKALADLWDDLFGKEVAS